MKSRRLPDLNLHFTFFSPFLGRESFFRVGTGETEKDESCDFGANLNDETSPVKERDVS